MVPKNSGIYDTTLQNMWSSNDDGAGFMYAADNELHIHKGFMAFDDFMNAYEEHRHRKAVLHFRIKTHGKADPNNTHPFQVTKNIGFVHNGVLSNVKTPNPEWSDTWHFNENILIPMMKNRVGVLKNQSFLTLLEGFIGGGNKLVFMDNKGETTIVNASAGNVNSGIWFSNYSWKDRPATQYKRGSLSQSAYQGSLIGGAYNDPRYKGFDNDESFLTPWKSSPAKEVEEKTPTIPPAKYAKFLISMGVFQKGDLVAVNFHYSDRTCEVQGINGAHPKSRVSYIYLDWLTEEEFQSLQYDTAPAPIEETEVEVVSLPEINGVFVARYGHFQKGDVVIVEDMDDKEADVFDTSKQKSYVVPIDRLEIKIL